jgi:predicted metal-dependent HD superfamily phosphohydrolase
MEKHRHYHNPRHLIFCLQQLDSSASLMEDKDAIEMAIWFHDVIFEPMASDNEERSAGLFKIVAEGHFSSNFVDTVSDIIVATKHHDAPGSSNKAYMLDIDLSSLGIPWMYFRQDCIDLRAELTGISDIRFYSGKLKFFNTLISRPRIYFTDSFFTRYELEARRNIMRYTSLLETQGYCR